MKNLFFILLTLSLSDLSACSSLVDTSLIPSEPIAPSGERLDAALCEEAVDGGIVQVDNEDFRLNEDGIGVGQFSFEGVVIQREELAPFSGEMVDIVYLVVADDGSEAYDYFSSYAEKNDSINKVIDAALYFKLGVLIGEDLVYDAEMMEGTEEKILTALKSGGSLKFTMLEAITLGSGANESSVMPCLFDVD